MLIDCISRFTPLAPGDVISTGTPGGVGDRRNPSVHRKDDDVIEAGLTGLGVFSNRIGMAT